MASRRRSSVRFGWSRVIGRGTVGLLGGESNETVDGSPRLSANVGESVGGRLDLPAALGLS